MTLQIPLSQIGDPDAFKARVETFRQAKLDHHKTEGEPAPREHELVEACVVRVPKGDAPDDYVIAPYEIIDDTPPLPSLRERKDALIAQVAAREHALMVASMPPGKRRLHGMQVHDISLKPEAERSDHDKRSLAEHADRVAREAAIGRHAAEQMAAIEDLTEDAIGGWSMQAFPENAASL